uniref:Leishmanolysin-like peptidase n=1 Tax=Trichobilharzia regenti TaxID=157069 RepID=A0AA85KJ11_TRIRE|nr:unnamed protein product [Trichobilharzia regenti]
MCADNIFYKREAETRCELLMDFLFSQNDYFIMVKRIIFLLHLLALSIGSEHVCRTIQDIKMTYAIVSHSVQKRQTSSNELKFHVYYTVQLKSMENFIQFEKNVVNKALKFWENALKVKDKSGEHVLTYRPCEGQPAVIDEATGMAYCPNGCRDTVKCYDYDVPKEYLSGCKMRNEEGSVYTVHEDGIGVLPNAYIIIVDSSNSTNCGGGTIAYAAPCQLHPFTDRPIIGIINFCPDKLNAANLDIPLMASTATHEITHALGFTPANFALMRDENGNPRTPRDSQSDTPIKIDTKSGFFIPSNNTLRTINRTWVTAKGVFTKVYQSLVTPNILEEARRHYGCTELDGVDLENEGGDGTANAHFEKRIIGDELMAGATGVKLIPSRITLAYFKDTGWYDVNYSMSGNWIYGKNLGCDFVMKSCYEYMRNRKSVEKSIWPYCDQPLTVSCMNRNTYGQCSLQKSKHVIPEEEQYFGPDSEFGENESAFYKGVAALVESCPVFVPMQYLYDDKIISYCDHQGNKEVIASGENLYMQSFGDNSICIIHDSPWHLIRGKAYMKDKRILGTCHKYSCSEKLEIIIGNRSMACPIEGGIINFTAKREKLKLMGRIKCPNYVSICKVTKEN